MKGIFNFFLFLISINSFGQNPALVYGPYLQQGGQTSMIISWRTDIVCDSRVKFGLTNNALNQVFTNGNSVTQHSLALNGLIPNTQYFYTITNTANTFTCDTFYFYTAPPNNTTQKIRVVVTGDCGTGLPTQFNVRNALKNYINNRYINCWLTLGDNAYYNGLDAEYSSLFFAPYQTNFIMHNTCLYPAVGNHDYANNAILCENKAIPYYDLFNVPANAELGGIASNTEAYYSYNYGNIHFVSIDSYGTEAALKVYDTLSLHYQWLKQDLQQNNSMWTIIYFHHPPYTMGSHNSDAEPDLAAMRTFLTPLFEKNKVDLVLSGHSHNLERSYLMKGHTGTEPTFSKIIHAKDSSSAKYDGSLNSCPYIKDTITNKGVVYTVCGSSGWVTGTQVSYPHDAMCNSYSVLGSGGFIEVEGNRLSAYFIGEDSLVKDRFTIFKNVNKNKLLWCMPGQSYTLNASWNGNYVWSFNAQTTKQNVYTASTSTMLVVRDSLNCVADTFFVAIGTGLTEIEKAKFKLFPNPVQGNEINIECEIKSEIKWIQLFDINGKEFKIINWEISNDEIKLRLPELANGEYLLKINTAEEKISKKIILRN